MLANRNFIIVAVLVLSLGRLLSVRAETPRAPEPRRGEEFRAVRFSDAEEAATRQLNELAAEGWQYVGPLGKGLVAYRRDRQIDSAATALQGEWEYLSCEEDGVVTEYKPAHRMTLSIDGKEWSVGPSPGAAPPHRVEIHGRQLVLHGIVAAGSLAAGETAPPRTVAWGYYELQGDNLAYTMTPNIPVSSLAPGIVAVSVQKPTSLETVGTGNTLYRLRRKPSVAAVAD